MAHLFTTLTAALVFVHSVFGCCVHHAHAVEDGERHPDAAATMPHEAHDHASHAGDVLGGACCQPLQSHRHSHECDEGRCNFARTEVSADQSSKVSAVVWLPGDAALPNRSGLQQLRSRERNDEGVASFSLGRTALRTHLSLSILLI